MKTPLRVHICPIGFEVLRVVEPLLQMRADKAYLLSGPDKAGQSFAIRVKRILRRRNKAIELKEDSIDLWDLFKCITKFKQIIHDEEGNIVYINVSTGTKVTAIAGTIVSMLESTNPYYARVNYRLQSPSDLPPEKVREPFLIPVYKIQPPKAEAVKILELLNGSGGSLRKRELIRRLEALNIIRPVGSASLSPSAAHNQLRTLLEPLQRNWNFVRVVNRGRSSLVELTDDGRKAIQVFR